MLGWRWDHAEYAAAMDGSMVWTCAQRDIQCNLQREVLGHASEGVAEKWEGFVDKRDRRRRGGGVGRAVSVEKEAG